MLLQVDKSLEKGDIVSLKLVGGEEIIAKYESIGDDPVRNEPVIRIQKPLTLAATPQGMVFLPYMVSMQDDKQISIPLVQVTVYMLTRDEIKSHYIESTSSIVTPKTQPGLIKNLNDLR